jgi:hypothetical protein
MTTTTQLITIFSIMFAINIGLAMFQEASLEVNPSASTIFDTANSPYSKYVQDNTLIVGAEKLPVDEDVEADTSGNIFTDTWAKVKSWFSSGLESLDFIGSILKQPYDFLKTSGIPPAICGGFALIWYIFALIIIVSWWGGR